MSVKSKNSKAIDRPFASSVMEKAKKLADQYQIVLTYEDGEWFAHGLELATVFADGKTVAKCVTNIREALAAAVATMLEEGQTPPLPAKSGIRSEQVNIRLTIEEKTVIEEVAKQRGFRGLSDFVRAGAMAFTK
jgi:predicted RNase H-like HicB family nuclease